MKLRRLSSGGEEMIMPKVLASMFTPARILLPTDFSESSQSALQMATDLAKTFKAELYLLHVVSMFPTGAGTEYFPESQYLHHGTQQGERQLSLHVAELASRGIKAQFAVEVGNDVVGSIMMVIERENIDMIVLSTHGLSGWRPVVFGSIAEKVIKLVQCPLLLFRSVAASATPERSIRALELTQIAAVNGSC
jgi:nucleotide-binding universal stress UspA family protein